MDLDHYGKTPPVMVLSKTHSLEGLLTEAIDKVMPLALQITLDKNEEREPTFRNILHVVASCCHQRYLSMTETGTFVGLSTGRHFVRKMNTEITNQLTMDDAIFHSFRSLAAVQPTVSIADLSTYISGAFSFPESLGADEIYDKVRCSVESLKVWGRVLMEDGKYKLPLDDRKATDLPNGPEAKAIPTVNEVRQPDGKYGLTAKEEVTEPEEGELILEKSAIGVTSPSPHPQSLTRFTKDDKSFFRRVHQDTSAVGRKKIGVVPTGRIGRKRSRPSSVPRKVHCYGVFITIENSAKNVHWSLAVIRSLFLKAQLNFGTITLGKGLKPFAFVGMRNVEDGKMAINSLNGRVLQGGAFQLVVEWAKSSHGL